MISIPKRLMIATIAVLPRHRILGLEQGASVMRDPIMCSPMAIATGG
jgi:hypothetical protein